MKCTDIQIGDINAKEKTTLRQFDASAEAKSSLGKLFIALTRETAWSDGYGIKAYLIDSPGQRPCLVIEHPAFVRPLVIKDGDGTDLSLRGVEDSVRTHFNECREWLQPTIEHLNGQVNDMHRASEEIAVDKARAAIVAAFPEAIDVSQTPTVEHDLYAFFKKGMDRGPIYVARELDYEFVGGVARIDCNVSYWYGQLRSGIEKGQRHGLFWTELARAFAACGFRISKEKLYCKSVSATEKPWAFPQVEPYVVEKVVLRASGEKEDIIVLFGVNNLPTKAYRESQVVGLTDKHMTP